MKYINFLIFILFLINFESSNAENKDLNSKITKNLRCLICQGQSVYDSDSEFANSLKILVDKKLNEGFTEKQIYDYLESKYGKWILFDPKFYNNYSQTAVDSHLDKLKSPLHALAFEYRYLIFKYYDIEIRSPFYDLELINLCVSLPSRWKLRHGRSRYILRSYLKGKVPDLVSQRRHKANLLHGIINNIGENDINKIKKELENIHPLLKNIVNKERILESISRLNGKNEITDFEVTSLLGFFSANRWLRNNKKIH